MRTTEKSEMIEIDEATADLAQARVSLAAAKDASIRAHAGFLDPLIDFEDNQWIRVAIAERRERDAFIARDAGLRRRSRAAMWWMLFGVKTSSTTVATAPKKMTTGAVSEEMHR